MKNKMCTRVGVIRATVLTAILMGTLSASAEVWTGAGDGTSYEDPLNWNPSTNAFPGSTRDISGAFTVTRDVDVVVERTFVKNGAVLNVPSGTHNDNRSGANIFNYLGDTGVGVVNQSGGSYSIGHGLRIGTGGGSGNGTYNLTGGDLIVYRGSNSAIDTSNPGGRPSMEIGDNNGGNGLFEISNGSLATRGGVHIGNAGTFSVLGSEASSIGIGSNQSGDGTWLQTAGGTLKVGIDLGGVTKIFIDEVDGDGDQQASFESGSILDVDYYGDGYGGGTWTVLELQNGTITNNGLAFAPGVDTNIWSFSIDNSGANGKLILTAAGDPPPVQPDVTLTVGDTRNRMMRYGLDYERLWFWYGSGLGDVPQWSVNDCNIDYIRTAMNSGYELTEGVFDLSAYTSKIIPMMTAMQNANPHIKWFASPRPLNEAYPNKEWMGEAVTWQPYPIWITGASTPTNSNFNFNDIKCSEYLIRYLLLMKSYGFKITYIDVTNEWQSNVAGGRVTQSDVRDIAAEFQAYLLSPWEHPDIPGLVLTAEDIPLIVAPSAWNYPQGAGWIDGLDVGSPNDQAKKDAVDIAACHNTNKDGNAQQFANAVATNCNPGTEIWETEQHGWKSTSGANEVTSFSFYMESIRAGFTGINGWLAIGTTSQGHCYLLNNGSTVTRNVKYYMFKKLSTTSNYGYGLDVNEPPELNNTMALIRENLLTVWVNNTSPSEVLTEIDFSDYTRDASDITYTRWNEALSVEGLEDTPSSSTSSNVIVNVEGESVYCIEIPLADPQDNFPFVQAENYDAGTGVSVLPCSDTGGGDMVAFASAGNEISFDLDITKTYNHDVAFRVASASADIEFDIYDGTNLLASVDRVATGDAQKWTTLYTSLTLDGGPMNLRIVATGGGWNLNWIRFDQEFSSYGITLANLAEGESASVSNVYQNNPTYGADKAVDGNTGTRWATDTSPAWLEVDFGTPTAINGVLFVEYGNRTTSYQIRYYDGTWKTASVGGNPDDNVVYNFPTVTGTKFRYQSITATGNPSIYEFELYNDPYYTESDPSVAIVTKEPDCITLSWSGVEGSTYTLQRSTNLMDGFTTIESGIPVHEATNFNILATPHDAAFYRVLLED